MTKIMVWDDVLDAGNLIKRVVEKKDREIFVCTEEKEVLGYIQSNKIDLALLDVNMRRTNGIERLRSLTKSLSGIPIIMFTYCPAIKTKEEAFRIGACDLWVKPMDNVILAAKVDAAFMEINPSFLDLNSRMAEKMI